MPLRERKLQRLNGYDYSRNNYYFVTICTHKRIHFFGEIKDGEMILNEFGEIVKNQWLWLQKQYNYILLEEFVVMPNHFHGILIINSDNLKRRNGQARSVHINGGNQDSKEGIESSVYSVHNNEGENIKILSLSQLIGAFKTLSSRDIHKLEESKYNNKIFKWHKSFHDRIIRNEKELHNIMNYIKNNPFKWHLDIENTKENTPNPYETGLINQFVYGTGLTVPNNNRPYEISDKARKAYYDQIMEEIK